MNNQVNLSCFSPVNALILLTIYNIFVQKDTCFNVLTIKLRLKACSSSRAPSSV